MQEFARGVMGLSLPIANVFMIGERGGPWVLVDAELPGQATRIRRAAEAWYGQGARPEAIILTHGHFDHVGSAKDLARYWDVPIYAPRLELPYLTGRSKYPPPDPTVGGFMAQVSRLFPSGSPNLQPYVREMPEEELPGLPGWRVIPTPGHSPGHVSFFREEDRTLIAGDAFVTVNMDSGIDMVTRKPVIARPPNYYTADWEQARESVRRLAALRPHSAGTGHGLPLSGPDLMAGLEALAERFPVPEHGRYVVHPAETDEGGVVKLPPPAPDPVPAALVGIALVAAAGVALSRAGSGSRGGERR